MNYTFSKFYFTIRKFSSPFFYLRFCFLLISLTVHISYLLLNDGVCDYDEVNVGGPESGFNGNQRVVSAEVWGIEKGAEYTLLVDLSFIVLLLRLRLLLPACDQIWGYVNYPFVHPSSRALVLILVITLKVRWRKKEATMTRTKTLDESWKG